MLNRLEAKQKSYLSNSKTIGFQRNPRSGQFNFKNIQPLGQTQDILNSKFARIVVHSCCILFNIFKHIQHRYVHILWYSFILHFRIHKFRWKRKWKKKKKKVIKAGRAFFADWLRYSGIWLVILLHITVSLERTTEFQHSEYKLKVKSLHLF